MAEALFYLLAGCTIGFGVGVVVARQPLFSVLSLLGSFFCLSGIYLLAGFQFLAATQLLVYVGAIMVLFLYVIMLLNLGDEQDVQRQTGIAFRGKRLAIAVAAAGALALTGVVSIGWSSEAFVTPEPLAEHGVDEMQTLAEVLFSRYALPFEASSVLLLATMIAVIALAKRQRTGQPSDPDLAWPYRKGAGQ